MLKMMLIGILHTLLGVEGLMTVLLGLIGLSLKNGSATMV